jgi:hypothetical protein
VGLAERLCEEFGMALPADLALRASAQAHVLEGRGKHRVAETAFGEAVERLRALGGGLEHAYAVLGQGRCLAALGDPAAEQTLRDARALFAEMGAQPRVDECDEVLEQVTRLSS